MVKLKIGDIVEIETAKGFVYALYSHRHKQYGALLRVFSRTYTTRPNDLVVVVADRVAFSCFFPLSTAVNRAIVSIVGNVGVPDALSPFPTFRAGVADQETGKVADWWLWDGEKEWRVGELTQEQRMLSILGVWNDTFLIERIESGWRPESDSK